MWLSTHGDRFQDTTEHRWQSAELWPVYSNLHTPIPYSTFFIFCQGEDRTRALRTLAKCSASERTPAVDSKPLVDHLQRLRKVAHIHPFTLWTQHSILHVARPS